MITYINHSNNSKFSGFFATSFAKLKSKRLLLDISNVSELERELERVCMYVRGREKERFIRRDTGSNKAAVRGERQRNERKEEKVEG